MTDVTGNTSAEMKMAIENRKTAMLTKPPNILCSENYLIILAGT
ncbi:hypothetical protein [Parvularcula marina]|nr:hypothetical protein [Parvularcula marina]